MAGSLGVFTGAGISTAPPASLPLGDDFHDRLLRRCAAAARRFAPDAVSDSGLRLLVTGGRRNILGCIEDCLPAGTTAGVLECMRVRMPTEAHLLCALHASHGARNITINFDNGIELAHALLVGTADLPTGVPAAYHAALARWRRHVADRTPLRVVSTPAQLRQRRYADRPTLIKLRGSVDRGTDETVIPLRPALEDLESTHLDEDRFAALAAVTGCDRLLITGHSGRDLDCFESLRVLLRPGAFHWVVPEVAPLVAARIHAIDPDQPRLGTAEEALRAELPDVPPWPRPDRPAAGAFRAAFDTWWAQIPVAAAAEAYAWMLADAGRYREPIAVLRALLLTRNDPRVRLRLADVLVRRGRPADLAEAERSYAAAGPDCPPELRGYLTARRTEARPGADPAELLAALADTATSWPADTATSWPTGPVAETAGRAAIRSAAVLARILRDRVDGGPAAVPPATGADLARQALAVLRAARRHAHRIGTGARQSDLELEIVAWETLLHLFGGEPPATDATARLAAVERAYFHRGDAVGGLRVLAVRALGSLAAGRPAEFAETVSEIERRSRRREYAPVAQDLAARLRRWAPAPSEQKDPPAYEGEVTGRCRVDAGMTRLP